MQKTSHKAKRTKSEKARYRRVLKSSLAFATALLLGGSTLSAQATRKRAIDRLVLDTYAHVLVPNAEHAGLGGGLGVGFDLRYINLFLYSTAMLAESRTILNPTLRIEGSIGLLPSLLTLMPYIDVGSISVPLRLPGGRGESSRKTALYAAFGTGAELLMTHELSLIFRLGVAHALLYSDTDSNNFSGPTIELAMRYTFGRNRGLDY